MNLGFEVTAAVPKRLRAVEEPPVQQAMRGERKVTQAPSTDQKKVRRAMQRKMAAGFTPHDHPETDEHHATEHECRGTMCTSEHNPENQVERAPHDVARDLQSRFESSDEVHVHPDKPNTFIVNPHNTWDGPTHVTRHGEGDYSFNGYQGHSHFGPNAHGGGNCPTCGKTAAATVIVPGEGGDPNLHKGHWGDLQPGDHVVGLNGSRVETVEHVNRYGEKVQNGHHTHVRMTFSNPDPLWHDSVSKPRTEHRFTPTDHHSMQPDLAFYRHSDDPQHTAANFSAGNCRMCEGNLIPMGQSKGSKDTMRAQCADCGTKHELQGGEVKKISALAYEAFQNLPEVEKKRLRYIAWMEHQFEHVAKCENCGAGHSDMEQIGIAGGGSGGKYQSGIIARCNKCNHMTQVFDDENPSGNHPDRPSKYTRTARLVALMGCTWVPVVDTSPYLAQSGMSAIARRAQSVLDTKETL